MACTLQEDSPERENMIRVRTSCHVNTAYETDPKRRSWETGRLPHRPKQARYAPSPDPHKCTPPKHRPARDALAELCNCVNASTEGLMPNWPIPCPVLTSFCSPLANLQLGDLLPTQKDPLRRSFFEPDNTIGGGHVKMGGVRGCSKMVA